MSSNFSPDWTSSPGDTITDVLEERALGVAEFAALMGRSIEDTRGLLSGSEPITLGVARRLQDTLGSTVTFWMSRDAQFRDDRARIEAAEWLEKLPIKDMMNFGWIDPTQGEADRLLACLGFFGVSSVDQWKRSYAPLLAATAFRTSETLASEPASVVAWLRQGELASESTPCSQWDKEKFRRALPHLRELTRRKSPGEFLPDLQEACAQCGVAVAVVRSPSGCRASGATRFLSPDRALLLLSGRHLTDDHLWFSFFHEAAHLLLHGDRLFIEFSDPVRTREEREANELAAELLIPKEHLRDLLTLPARHRDVLRFARRVGISPGVVVGQLQHYERIGYDRLNRLKRRFTWGG